jgi:hypothetical protein
MNTDTEIGNTVTVIETDCGHTERVQWGSSCLTPLLTVFQLYCAVSFIDGGNRSTQRKTLVCRQSNKLYQIIFSTLKAIDLLS